MTNFSHEILNFTIAGTAQYVGAVQFCKTLADTLEVLSEIDANISISESASLEWRVVQASTESPLTIGLEAIPTETADHGQQVISSFFDGLEAIEHQGRIPAGYTPKAMNSLKDLVGRFNQGVSSVTFASRSRRYSPNRQFISNVASITKKTIEFAEDARSDYYEYGQINGKVETPSSHSQNYFNVYDSLTNARLKCTFDKELTEDLRSAWGKRVVVTGRIKFASDGTPKTMRADSLQFKPDVESLPQFKDFAIDITGGIESSEYVRGLRDDD